MSSLISRTAETWSGVSVYKNAFSNSVCQCVSCGEFGDAPEAQDWCFTKWLGISEDVQGRGLGRHLLQRALLELRGAGYQHAAISTGCDNPRAALFYTNLGYRVIDWTYAYGRRIDQP